ncbi:hypothetical protein QWY14_13545 [Planococcus sp. N028]|uniref:Uncharacterized protein n=1 Tax=Planococcus shixiaomingii TaxID=3058393 RepID=A0ABT8N4L0_9BACL|nr:hypothetical protein [Planococcus sp. N028]MDN7242832.1 hypothetical protein [Planococcus sp. N028]
MRGFILYAGVVLGNFALIKLSERWYGAAWFTEWLFGLLTVGLFALFLKGWKHINASSGGLVFVTALSMLAIDSIFFVQDLPAIICSFLLGLLLIPSYSNHRDGALTAGGFVLANIVINIETESSVTVWLILVMTGIGALIGSRFRYPLLKRCFTVLFSLAAILLLLINFFEEAYFIVLVLVVFILLVAGGSYKFSRPSVS